ncbi:MAG: HAMP domain-containing sensor histidine kinase [Campylobacterota bacterium]|nr:HAMP domain-containing sensor histidine kinase [Campylobacterota bacterium]
MIFFDITDSVEYRKENTIKRLAEGLTHEINTAVSSIKGNIEILQSDIETIKDQDQKELMLDSLSNIRKNKRIIQDIVKTLYYTNDIGIQKKQTIDIKSSINKILQSYEDKLINNDIDILINIPDDLTFSFNYDSLIHLLQILIDNMVDALIEKEGNGLLQIITEQSKENLSIIFKDNGNGIDKSIIPDIFNPLTKGKSYGGIGIGLFVAKLIVNSNNGKISFNTSNKGTTFKLIFDI